MTTAQRGPPVLLLLALGALALGCGDRDRGPLLRDTDMPALERQGDSLRAAVETFRQRRGAYPASLAEAGLTDSALATPFGPWRYARASEGDVVAPECRGPYSLGVGDYDRHHFEVCWGWRRGGWDWNR